VTSPLRIERAGEIAVVAIDNPPVNALSLAVRQGLLAAILELDADASARAIVLHGAGRLFVAGADVREFDQPPASPLLPELLDRLEACGKPVIAALHGAVLGGGAELALACHYRCGTADLRLGFPEVKLGLIPGAGGTLRLPRLVGVKSALDLMTSGEPVGLGTASALGLIDIIIEREPLEGAVAYARDLLAAGANVRRVRDRPVPQAAGASTAFFQAYRASLPRALRKTMAAEHIVQAVESTVTLPFDAAAARTRELFEACRASTESKALRHLFFAERPARPAASLVRPVASVGVVGAGTMGCGIALAFAQAGIEVTVFDANTSALASGLERLRTMLDSAVQKGRLSDEAAVQAHSRLRPGGSLNDLGRADLIVEAVFESMAVKEQVFRELGAICKPEALLATNTSTLDIDIIANASGRAPNVVGMHFFSPAHVMRLVEVVRGSASAPDSVATAIAVTQRIGKIGVTVGNCFGFAGNRMLQPYGREKESMLLEGATPEQIDRALEQFGMAMGPNAVGDLAGLDIGASARREWKHRPDDARYYRISDLLVERGRLGQKSGRGFYRYEGQDRRPLPDPEVTELIHAEARRLGVPQREIADREIVERCVFALVNEGAHILEEGVAQRAADLDVIWCNGYGFPRTRGGPMFYADTVGLRYVLESIERYGREHGERYWAAAPLLARLAREGGRFSAA
jgi:3-hydroxyacyl-CoA dehydrogenase